MTATASVPLPRRLLPHEIAGVVSQLEAAGAEIDSDTDGSLRLRVHWGDRQGFDLLQSKRRLAGIIAALVYPGICSRVRHAHARPEKPTDLVEVLPLTFVGLPALAELVDHVDSRLAALMRKFGARAYILPSLLPRDVLPASVLGTAALGPDIPLGSPGGTSPMRLTHAACLGLYPLFSRREVELEVGTSRVKCFRAEGSYSWPHLAEYSVREFVAIGDIATVEDLALQLEHALVELFGGWGVGLQARTATDSFLEADGATAMCQSLCAAKRELVFDGTALGSINLHRGHFTRRWAITYRGGDAASICVGVGLERAAAALLQGHDADSEKARAALDGG